jgi:hypothetical protein
MNKAKSTERGAGSKTRYFPVSAFRRCLESGKKIFHCVNLLRSRASKQRSDMFKHFILLPCAAALCYTIFERIARTHLDREIN